MKRRDLCSRRALAALALARHAPALGPALSQPSRARRSSRSRPAARSTRSAASLAQKLGRAARPADRRREQARRQRHHRRRRGRQGAGRRLHAAVQRLDLRDRADDDEVGAVYDVVKDFTPVALVAKAPLSVAINKNLPVTDIKSLLAYAKANPRQADLRGRLDRLGGPPAHRAAASAPATSSTWSCRTRARRRRSRT